MTTAFRDRGPATSGVCLPFFRLGSGIANPNRLVKAAMREQLTQPVGRPGAWLVTLHRPWDRGGAAVMLTGNVMVGWAGPSAPWTGRGGCGRHRG